LSPILMLPRRTFRHSASNVLGFHISCRIIAVFVFRKPLFMNKLYRIYVCYKNIRLQDSYIPRPTHIYNRTK
jgi:hypothetical protein